MSRLPPPIPGNVYRHVEYKIRHREQNMRNALKALNDAEKDAGAISSPLGGSGCSGGGEIDRTAALAINLAAARDRLKRAKAWIAVYKKTLEAFKGTEPGRAIRLIFENGKTQADTAREMGRDRQTVRRYKDDFIIRAAFVAVSYRLVRFDGKGNINDQD